MEFQHIEYGKGSGEKSKQMETYNFHKASAVLAEYGFDCIRLSNDWQGTDFLAHHPDTGKTLKVQLKTGLVIDKKYKHRPDLYMCFTLDRTGATWYLVKHQRLMEIVKEHSPEKFDLKSWENKGIYWTWTASTEVREALEEFAYRSCMGDFGFRECRNVLKQDGRTMVEETCGKMIGRIESLSECAWESKTVG